MADMRRSAGLQTIFSFFLGLMVTAFIGVGVYTFHPPPQREMAPRIEDLNRREQAIRNLKPPNELTNIDREQIQELTDERNELLDASLVTREGWGRSTSIILITLATFAMAVSLVRADRLPVISNGLLLGGVFAMVYGIGWIVATDTSVTRFLVMTVALAITLAFGYVRFVRHEMIPATSVDRSIENGEGLEGIERRLRELEDRMNDAAHALRQKSDHGRES